MRQKGRLIAAAVAVRLATACDRAAPFEVVGVDLPTAGVAPNDPIAVRFSRPVADVPPDGALRVMHDGTRLASRLTIANDVIRIHPASADGWPAGRTLRLEIPTTTLGRPLHAKDGAALERAFETPGGRPLTSGLPATERCRSPPPTFLCATSRRKPCSNSRSTRRSIRPRSTSGIEVRDASGRPVPGARVVAAGPRSVAVSPFVYIPPGPSESFTLAANSRLRSLDGRRLAKGHSWRLTTTRFGDLGEFSTSFAAKDLDNPSLAIAGGGLRPIATATVHEVPRALDDPEARASRRSSRSRPACRRCFPFRTNRCAPTPSR
jgi:hypothetical protein